MGRFSISSMAVALWLVCACTSPAGGTDGGRDVEPSGDGTDTGQPTQCVTDGDCSDHVFCNGVERCSPGAQGASAAGCLAATSGPCTASQRCVEGTQICEARCDVALDGDGDGHRAVACGGDDCDDGDDNRFPGNAEVCDSAGHDEDCEVTSFGFRDGDMDLYVDSHCCNTDAAGAMHCGDDCNDSRPNVHPALTETCDGLDNDCNGMIDEGATRTFYPDADGDGFGDASATMGVAACFMPPHTSDNHTDCNDSDGAIHPAAPETCDSAIPPVDENCDGVANPASQCTCVGAGSRPCSLPGACSAGVETCAGGAWGTCSIAPTTETCNGVDDDCNGIIDDALRVTCYADADNDGYAASGAAASPVCPQTGRESVGGCPVLYTNAPPSGANVDCNDAASAIRPGATEICVDLATTRVDDNCNGVADEGLRVDCYPDGDNDTYAAAGATRQHRCIDPTRSAVAGCPFRSTNRAPLAGAIDCNDNYATAHPGGTEVCDAPVGMNPPIDENCDGVANPMSLCACTNGATQACPQPGRCTAGMQTCSAGVWGACSVSPVPEVCNSIDDDCDGVVDNGVQTVCYADGDGDGYALPSAATTRLCGACGTGYTTANTDCDDTNNTVYPGAPELCDLIHNNCNNGTGTFAAEDSDGDGHSPIAGVCSGGRYATDDCNDSNASVFPGQTAWFTTPYCTGGCTYTSGMCACRPGTSGVVTYDYNCNMAPDKPPVGLCTASGTTCTPRPGCGTSGPVSTTPACGASVSYVTCSCSITSRCSIAMSTAPMRCH